MIEPFRIPGVRRGVCSNRDSLWNAVISIQRERQVQQDQLVHDTLEMSINVVHNYELVSADIRELVHRTSFAVSFEVIWVRDYSSPRAALDFTLMLLRRHRHPGYPWRCLRREVLLVALWACPASSRSLLRAWCGDGPLAGWQHVRSPQ